MEPNVAYISSRLAGSFKTIGWPYSANVTCSCDNKPNARCAWQIVYWRQTTSFPSISSGFLIFQTRFFWLILLPNFLDFDLKSIITNRFWQSWKKQPCFFYAEFTGAHYRAPAQQWCWRCSFCALLSLGCKRRPPQAVSRSRVFSPMHATCLSPTMKWCSLQLVRHPWMSPLWQSHGRTCLPKASSKTLPRQPSLQVSMPQWPIRRVGRSSNQPAVCCQPMQR